MSQTIINIVINYILIGILFQFFTVRSISINQMNLKFGHSERILLILMWPIGVIAFIKGFITGSNNDKE